MSTAARVHYGGRRFRPTDNPGGALGEYFQRGDLVWAEFSGAGVLAGRLVGTCRPDGVIEAAYCLVGPGGETVAGTCVSTPTVLPDGRVRLTEQWRRMDGTSGVSHIEELSGSEAAVSPGLRSSAGARNERRAADEGRRHHRRPRGSER